MVSEDGRVSSGLQIWLIYHAMTGTVDVFPKEMALISAH